MATVRYYWLKLRVEFFKDKRIKKLRKLAGGDTYTIIYLKMQLLSVQNGGVLYFEGVEEDFAHEIALELDEDIENVRVTIAYLFANGLIEEVDADNYVLPQAVESIGSEGSSAERMRRLRARKQQQLAEQKAIEASLCDNDVRLCDTDIRDKSIDKDKELDIDKESDYDKEIHNDKEIDNNSLVHSDEMHEVEFQSETQNSADIGEKPKRKRKSNGPSKEEVEAVFEQLWKLYPVKRGKGSISYATKLKVYGVREQIPRCIERYIDDTKKRFGHREGGYQRWLKNGSTFFNSGYVDYLEENYEELQGVGDTGGKKGFKESTLEEFEREMRLANGS